MTTSPSNSALTDAVRAVIGEAIYDAIQADKDDSPLREYEPPCVFVDRVLKDLAPLLSAAEGMRREIQKYNDHCDLYNDELDSWEAFDAALADLTRRNDAK